MRCSGHDTTGLLAWCPEGEAGAVAVSHHGIAGALHGLPQDAVVGHKQRAVALRRAARLALQRDALRMVRLQGAAPSGLSAHALPCGAELIGEAMGGGQQTCMTTSPSRSTAHAGTSCPALLAAAALPSLDTERRGPTTSLAVPGLTDG